MHSLDLHAVELPADGLLIENMPEAAALATWGTSGTASTASCPFSTASTAMTAGTAS
ncbi:thiocillin family RiPP [Sphaerisporangium krabiense]|uniref:Thiocillin family RiPP n=1 Tax=Sphaerisporangium krabiense TaxID=763782 RepID=A0A7W8Z614_9ACTN|nr:thiocillin family RiPP [Sphaerisporangium krabiense]MBB5627915.1 hypothetical protein [Sphaerisporangium krabiense]